MAAPPHPDDTWRSLIHAGYYEDAPSPACSYCNPELYLVRANGELNDTATSPPNDAPGTSAAAPPNDAPGTSQRRSEFPNTGTERKEKAVKECKCFFCIPCKQGGLCRKEFRADDRPHSGHARLQVFQMNHNDSVRKEDMVGYLDTTSVMGTSVNYRTLQLLRTVRASNAVCNVMHCPGCQENVAKTTSLRFTKENDRNARVCSIQCLLLSRPPPVNFRGAHRRKQLRPTRSPMQ